MKFSLGKTLIAPRYSMLDMAAVGFGMGIASGFDGGFISTLAILFVALAIGDALLALTRRIGRSGGAD